MSNEITISSDSGISVELIKQFVKKYGINCFHPYIYFEHGMIAEFDQHEGSPKILEEIFNYAYGKSLPFINEESEGEESEEEEFEEEEFEEEESEGESNNKRGDKPRIVPYGLFDKRKPFQVRYKKYNYTEFVSFAISFMSKSTTSLRSAGLGYAVTPLMYACMYGMYDIAVKLLATNDPNLRIDYVDENGRTALMYLFFGLTWRQKDIDGEINWNIDNEEKKQLFDTVCLSLLATGKSRPNLMTPSEIFLCKNRYKYGNKTAYMLAIETRKFGLAEAIYKQHAWEKRKEFVIGAMIEGIRDGRAH